MSNTLCEQHFGSFYLPSSILKLEFQLIWPGQPGQVVFQVNKKYFTNFFLPQLSNLKKFPPKVFVNPLHFAHKSIVNRNYTTKYLLQQICECNFLTRHYLLSCTCSWRVLMYHLSSLPIKYRCVFFCVVMFQVRMLFNFPLCLHVFVPPHTNIKNKK